MCAGNDGTFEVLEGILSEVADLFPAPWIHCGGGEPHTQVWAKCKLCQARMKAEKIDNVHGLYSYFMKRVEKIEPELFSRTMLHPRLKAPMRLVDHLYFVAEHDDHHLARIWEMVRGND